MCQQPHRHSRRLQALPPVENMPCAVSGARCSRAGSLSSRAGSLSSRAGTEHPARCCTAPRQVWPTGRELLMWPQRAANLSRAPTCRCACCLGANSSRAPGVPQTAACEAGAVKAAARLLRAPAGLRRSAAELLRELLPAFAAAPGLLVYGAFADVPSPKLPLLSAFEPVCLLCSCRRRTGPDPGRLADERNIALASHKCT